MTWLDAFRVALKAEWPTRVHSGIAELHKVLDSVAFTAPEVRGDLVRRAWSVLEVAGDTPVGRVAVALAYSIQALEDERGAS